MTFFWTLGSNSIKTEIFCILVITLLSDVHLHYRCKIQTLVQFYDVVIINKDWNMILKFLGKVKLLVFKNNLRIILGSIQEKCKNMKLGEKICIFIKIECIASNMSQSNSEMKNVTTNTYSNCSSVQSHVSGKSLLICFLGGFFAGFFTGFFSGFLKNIPPGLLMGISSI